MFNAVYTAGSSTDRCYMKFYWLCTWLNAVPINGQRSVWAIHLKFCYIFCKHGAESYQLNALICYH